MKQNPVLYPSLPIKAFVVIRAKFKPVPKVSFWAIPQGIAKLLDFKFDIGIKPLGNTVKLRIKTPHLSDKIRSHCPIRSFKVVGLKLRRMVIEPLGVV